LAFSVFDFAIADATPLRARQGTILVHKLPQLYTSMSL
jgi:hypothetical protein